jgi:hypothetical protein
MILFHPTKHYIFEKCSTVPHIESLSIYAYERYLAIENRLRDSFRYVDCEANNANTYSYEYASMLRDIGSVFASVMDKVVRIERNLDLKNEYGMGHYKKWLISNVPDIANVSVEIAINRTNRYLLPFEGLVDEHSKLEWWTAFTDLKHSDIDHYERGNLRFTLLSLSALVAIIMFSMPSGFNPPDMQLMHSVGMRLPHEELARIVFLR